MLTVIQQFHARTLDNGNKTRTEQLNFNYLPISTNK